MVWETKKLSDVCNIFNGLWKGKKPPFIEIGVIRNTNFTKDGLLDDSEIAYLPVEISQYEKKKLKFGDIILEKSGGGPKQPVGRVILFDKIKGEFSFSNFTSVIRIKNNTLLDSHFLHKFLYLIYISGFTISMQRQSTGIRNLQLIEYKKIDIPIPPLSLQKKIVEVLDDTFEKILKVKENAEQNLKNAKELFESYLDKINENKVFLGELINIKTGKLDSNAAIINGKYPFFTCSRNNFAIDSFAFDCEAILLAGNNAVGDFNVKHYKGKFNAYQRTYIITVNEKNKILYRFLYFQLIKSLKIFKQMSVGAGTKFLKVSMIKNLKVSLPKIEDQMKIVFKLDSLLEKSKRLESIYSRKLVLLEEFKQSILQKAFNGELAEAHGE